MTIAVLDTNDIVMDVLEDGARSIDSALCREDSHTPGHHGVSKSNLENYSFSIVTICGEAHRKRQCGGLKVMMSDSKVMDMVKIAQVNWRLHYVSRSYHRASLVAWIVPRHQFLAVALAAALPGSSLLFTAISFQKYLANIDHLCFFKRWSGLFVSTSAFSAERHSHLHLRSPHFWSSAFAVDVFLVQEASLWRGKTSSASFRITCPAWRLHQSHGNARARPHQHQVIIPAILCRQAKRAS